jgi:hypothetical protein
MLLTARPQGVDSREGKLRLRLGVVDDAKQLLKLNVVSMHNADLISISYSGQAKCTESRTEGS